MIGTEGADFLFLSDLRNNLTLSLEDSGINIPPLSKKMLPIKRFSFT